MTIRFNTVDVDGLKIFYRSAGDPSAPIVLLLHGFPSASHMFRDLIPELAGQYHVVAPDLPGFGMTEQPDRGAFAYTFENIAKVIGRFTEVLGWERFAIYVFDYGAPTGFRLALGAIGEGLFDPRPTAMESIEDGLRPGAVGYVGRRDADEQQEAIGADGDVAFAPDRLLGAVEAAPGSRGGRLDGLAIDDGGGGLDRSPLSEIAPIGLCRARWSVTHTPRVNFRKFSVSKLSNVLLGFSRYAAAR